ncbi:putative DnaJ type IV chaperone protein [Synechococcus sp. A15-127]|jgi:DnaJ-class molecular chaperone|nr:putative DnaJ type IV chaperone protein [Synechococcus sp. A15-127]
MTICTVCGGSGIQRVSSQRFRTCLACLGTGVISAAVQSAPLNQLATATVDANHVGCLPHARG